MPRPAHSKTAAQLPARRAFFKSALLGGGAVVAAAVAAQDAHSETPGAQSRPGNKAGQGYRETAAVRRYYQLAREV